MISELKPYLEYKDSGAPWLGRIPSHWSLVPAFSAFKERHERNVGLKEKQVLSLSYGRIIKKKEEALHGLVPDSFETYQIVEPGNLILRLTDLQNDQHSLRVGLARDHGIITSAYLCLSPQEGIIPSFGYYLLHSADVQKVFYGMGSGLRQSMDFRDLKRFPIAMPSLWEQKKIVSFLDSHSKDVDRYIRAKHRLIELLGEQKQAIIHRAVTRGLDPNVRLKPSGIVWLWDVPEHWEMVQLRRLVSFVTSGSRGWANFYNETGDIFLQSGNLGRSMSLNLSFIQHVQPPQGSEGERTRVRRDDVLVCITGALTGNVAHVDIDFSAPAFVNQHIALVRPNQTIVYPRYLAFALHSEIGRIQFKTGEYGGTKQGLGLDNVKSSLVPLPPILEQKTICSELNHKIALLAMAVSSSEREINLLREYRTRLIYDVVTGKLDVRGATLPAADEAEVPDEWNGMLETEADVIEDLELPELVQEEAD